MFHQPEIMFDFFVGGAIAVNFFCLSRCLRSCHGSIQNKTLCIDYLFKLSKGTGQSFKKNTPTTLHYPVIFSASP